MVDADGATLFSDLEKLEEKVNNNKFLKIIIIWIEQYMRNNGDTIIIGSRKFEKDS